VGIALPEDAITKGWYSLLLARVVVVGAHVKLVSRYKGNLALLKVTEEVVHVDI